MGNKESLPRFDRSENPPSMRFQARDEEILRVIYEYGGVVAKRQLKEIFWHDKSWRAMEKRLSKLYHNGYINRPDQDQWRRKPILEPVCWLGWKGALKVSEKWGLQIDQVRGDNENQLRKIENLLRKQGFLWMREPRWIQLEHDLAVVDFRLLLEKALHDSKTLTLVEWLHEGIFRSQTDVVEYEITGKNGLVRKMRKGVIPDAYFMLEDEQRKISGQPYRARFLLEMDRATHDNPSFGSEKSLPGAAYINSPAYKNRFGQNTGRWLVVTTAGERRMKNLMHQTDEKVGGRANLFFFTTMKYLGSNDILASDIWYQFSSKEPLPLIAKNF